MNNNRQESDNDEHEVHKQGCSQGAMIKNQLDLGWFENGIYAVAAAKLKYPHVATYINGCAYCNPEANTD